MRPKNFSDRELIHEVLENPDADELHRELADRLLKALDRQDEDEGIEGL